MIEWLTKNRIPVTESSEDSAILSVKGVLLMEPPYDRESCRCSHEIVLDCIQKLIRARKDKVGRYTLFKSKKHASPNNTQLVSMEGVFVQI